MYIDITELRSGILDKVDIDENYSFSKDELKGSGILELNDVRVVGYISQNSLNDYYINILVEGIMILPCSLTLKPTPYDFSVSVEGNLDEMMKEFTENYENNQKTIDILPIIWENILMEIPMRIVSDDVSDVKTKGEGWKLITDEEESVNPSLANLKNLL